MSSKADDTIASKEKRERERGEERKRDVQGRDDVTKNERKEQSTLISAFLLVARN